MIGINEFLPDVLPHVDGAPKTQVRRAVLLACRELCRESGIWRETLDPISTFAGIPEYDVITPTSAARPLFVTGGRHGVVPLAPATEEKLVSMLGPGWGNLTDDFASHFIHTAPAIIRLVPYPATSQPLSLVLRVAMEPTLDAAKVGDILFDEYAEVVAAGALARLMNVRDTAWYDPNMAASHRKEFRRGINYAKSRAIRGGTNREGAIRRRRLSGAP